jgi:hypothetical protein
LDSSFFVNHVFHVLVFCQKEQKVRYIHDVLIIPDFNWRRCIQSVRRCGDADSVWRFSSLTSNRAIHVSPCSGGSCPASARAPATQPTRPSHHFRHATTQLPWHLFRRQLQISNCANPEMIVHWKKLRKNMMLIAQRWSKGARA